MRNRPAPLHKLGLTSVWNEQVIQHVNDSVLPGDFILRDLGAVDKYRVAVDTARTVGIVCIYPVSDFKMAGTRTAVRISYREDDELV